jgi:hypothetical protein
MEKLDLLGEKYGRLTVIAEADPIYYNGRKASRWLCKCDCGATVLVTTNKLRAGSTKSCGCLAKEAGNKSIKNAAKASLAKKKADRDKLIGKRFGTWTVLEDAGRPKMGLYGVLCECDCGARAVVTINNLKRGESLGCKACGEKKVQDSLRETDLIDGTSLSHLTQKKRSDNTTGVKGVWFEKRSGKYIPELRIRGKKIWLGKYSRLEDAAKARQRAEEEYFDPILAKNNRPTTGEARQRGPSHG